MDVAAFILDAMPREHRAIVQYLLLAFSAGETALRFRLEAIARAKMYHYKWLGQLARDCAVTPSLERAPLALPAATLAAALHGDSAGDAQLLRLYNQAAASVSQPAARRLAQRLAEDTGQHVQQLDVLAAEADALAGREPAADAAAQPAEGAAVVALLAQDAAEQYAAILQYLRQSFMVADGHLAQRIEDIAIQEMQHLGPLRESIADLGGLPTMESAPVDTSETATAMLRANLRGEKMAQQQYQQHADAIADPALKAMLQRFRRQEIEHESIFSDLLASVAQAAPRFTVGSLKEQPHRPIVGGSS